MRRIVVPASSETLEQLDGLAAADGRHWRDEAELLLARAVAAEGRRRGRGADAKVGRLARELAEAVEELP